MAQNGSMSRGAMIRRLDQAAQDVAILLADDEPLTPEERRELTDSLGRLFLAVSNSLQLQEDKMAAGAIQQNRRSED